MSDYENEIPKYRKRKSAVSKSGRRADHKHCYEICLLIRDERPYPAKYCTICGKIYDEYYFPFEKSNGHCRMLGDNEIYEKYKGVRQFIIQDYNVKFVNLSNILSNEKKF